jgi:hypothetical protein
MTDFDDYLDTPTEADLDACYGSKYLSATEVGDRKIRTKIERIRKQALPQQGGGTRLKFILSFSTLDKELVLNATNKNVLVDRLGRNPADWIGADVGLFTEPTNMAGKPTRGLATAGAQQTEWHRRVATGVQAGHATVAGPNRRSRPRFRRRRRVNKPDGLRCTILGAAPHSRKACCGQRP